MSAFDLQESMLRALKRFGPDSGASNRAPRSDRGRPRLDPAVLACVEQACSGQERPRMRETLARIERLCGDAGLRPPSRATIYKLLATLPGRTYRTRDLPHAVAQVLYNLAQDAEVPGHQLAFFCFNYGDLAAISFGSGLPWLALYQALRMRGYRPKSRGLIESVARVRRI